jgi:inosine/xanthosine triphosphate pyrophosphatase family protein/adenylate kinase family enzyme
MLDITFITSNITKLAHARHLSEMYDVNVLHYKKKYYGIGYLEPRTPDKKHLLEESMNDAITRWKKNVSNNKTQLFFIEDTSVKIDALSDCNNEVPGTEIKYWMAEQNFLKLDSELKKRNNNRRVSVTSHIVLFLTKYIQERENHNDEYIMFTSTSTGKIINKECSIDTNILYPWLDNKTFNKWFVPDGFDFPISKLSITDANKADFRREAFEQMFNYIGKYYDITNNSKKNNFLNNNAYLPFIPMYIISGPTCAGKSTVGKYLLEKYGYYHIEASDFMSLKYYETHGTNFLIDKHNFASELLKKDPLVVVKSIFMYIKAKKVYDKFIVTGFRTSDEVTNFCDAFSNQDIKKIYITADFDIRFLRWQKRKRDINKYIIDQFHKINNLQDEMGLLKIKNINDVILFENNIEGIDILNSNFDKHFISNDIIKEKSNDFLNLKGMISLEKAILLTLAIEYYNNDYNYFTTTEISRLINTRFNGVGVIKNKNNVSRYFNQSYYPYYEIKTEKNRRKYKLSPTGYSEAKFIANRINHNSENKDKEVTYAL